MVISIGIGRCGCRIVNNPLMQTQKISLDLDSLSIENIGGTYHIEDTVVLSWFDVTIENKVSPCLIDKAKDSIRRFSEKSDRSDTIQFFSSPCGSSGGGLLSMLTESLADESYDVRLASLVFPHPKMIRRGHAINAVMTLGTVCDTVKSIFCFDNSTLLKTDFSDVNLVVAGCSESFIRFPSSIPKKYSIGNFFVKKSNRDNVLLQMESTLGRQRRELADRPVAIFSGSPIPDGSLVNSVDSVFGKNPTGKSALKLDIEKSLVAHGSLAIAYRDTTLVENIFRPIIVQAQKESALVPSNHSEWFTETMEKLKCEFL